MTISYKRPLTTRQQQLLYELERSFGTRRARGFIPVKAFMTSDSRSMQGLILRGHVVIDDTGRYRLSLDHRK